MIKLKIKTHHTTLHSLGLQYKKSATLPAEALLFTAADRNRKSDCANFLLKSSLAIGQSGSAALPLHCVPPFLFFTMSFFCIYIFHA